MWKDFWIDVRDGIVSVLVILMMAGAMIWAAGGW